MIRDDYFALSQLLSKEFLYKNHTQLLCVFLFAFLIKSTVWEHRKKSLPKEKPTLQFTHQISVRLLTTVF